MQFVHPSLLEAFPRGFGVDLGDDRHHARYVARLGLRAGHAAQPRRDEQHAARRGAVPGEALARGVHHRDRRTVDDALRPDVHVRSGGHLPVLRDAEGVHPLPVVGFRVVGDHHAVGHHDARRVGIRREKPERMARIHHQRLTVGHLREVLHRQTVLRPVLEHRAVAAVGNQFVGMLRHGLVQVVLDHQHDGRGLPALRGVFVDRPRVHLVVGTQAVHVDPAVLAQLGGELPGQHGVVPGGKVAQGVAQGQLLLGRRENVLTLGRMVDLSVVRLRGGQPVGNARADIGLKFG